MNKDFYNNILIRVPNWLGDAVMATAAISDVRMHFPSAKITALCQGAAAELFTHSPHIDEVVRFLPSPLFQKNPVIQSLKQNCYDLGILFTNSFSSAWWFWKAGIKHRVGYRKDARHFFLTHSLKFPSQLEELHLVEVYKYLLCPLGIPSSGTEPILYLTQDEKDSALTLLKEHGGNSSSLFIGVNPLAAYGPAKCWPQERYRSLIARLSKNPGCKVLVFGDKSGMPILNEICKGLSSNVVNLGGKTTLRQLISLISLCDLFLTNDSGPMHIAAALKTPLIALFGSTNDKKTGPYNHGTVVRKEVSCAPCYLRKCPIDFRCMNNIEVDDVYQLSQDYLAGISSLR